MKLARNVFLYLLIASNIQALEQNNQNFLEKLSNDLDVEGIENFILESEQYKKIIENYPDCDKYKTTFAKCLKLLLNDNLGMLKTKLDNLSQDPDQLYHLMLLEYCFNINDDFLWPCTIAAWLSLTESVVDKYINGDGSIVIEYNQKMPLGLSKLCARNDIKNLKKLEWLLVKSISLKTEPNVQNIKVHCRKDNYGVISSNNEVKLYDLETNKVIKSHTDHINKVIAAAFSPDEKLVITASEDKTIKVWDLKNDDIKTLRDGKNTPTALCLSSDGTKLYVGEENGNIIFWDLNDITNKPVGLTSMNNEITALGINHDGTQLAIGATDELYILDLNKTSKKINVEHYNPYYIRMISFLPNNGNYVLVASSRSIKIVSLITGNTVKSFYTDNYCYSNLCHDNEFIAYSNRDISHVSDINILSKLMKLVDGINFDQLTLMRIIYDDILLVQNTLENENHPLKKIYESLPTEIIMYINNLMIKEVKENTKTSSWRCDIL